MYEIFEHIDVPLELLEFRVLLHLPHACKLLHLEFVELDPELLDLLAEHVVELVEVLLTVLKFLDVRSGPSDLELGAGHLAFQFGDVAVLLLAGMVLVVEQFSGQLLDEVALLIQLLLQLGEVGLDLAVVLLFLDELLVEGFEQRQRELFVGEFIDAVVESDCIVTRVLSTSDLVFSATYSSLSRGKGSVLI